MPEELHSPWSVHHEPEPRESNSSQTAPGDYLSNSGLLDDLGPGPAYEITGGSGTLVLWHHNIIHGAAPNYSERVRMAGFQRFARDDIGDIGQSSLSDIWKMYPEIQNLEPAYHDAY